MHGQKMMAGSMLQVQKGPDQTRDMDDAKSGKKMPFSTHFARVTWPLRALIVEHHDLLPAS
jgi:hypothetical protein